MFIAHTAPGFWHHFHPRITQSMDLETVSHFGTPNYRKITKRCSKSLPRDSPNDPKITKNAHLDLQVPVGWPLDLSITKMITPGIQNGASRSQKWQLFEEKMTNFHSQPASSSLHPRGPAAGAKPSNNNNNKNNYTWKMRYLEVSCYEVFDIMRLRTYILQCVIYILHLRDGMFLWVLTILQLPNAI